MKRQLLILCVLAGVSCVSVTAGQEQQPRQDRIDLQTQTKVGKRLDRVVDGPNGKEYHYIYRVEASPTQQSMLRYAVDPRYHITHENKGFVEHDTVTLLSTNEESETDSPIWVYDVTYVGSGTRQIVFSTSGSVLIPMFATANSETGDPCECAGCAALSNCSCHVGCSCSHCPPCNCVGCQTRSPRCYTCPRGCSCSHCLPCNCIGCQSQNPKCTACPQGCTCSHCRCVCDGCQTQDPPCTFCPPGCYCDHCGCRCADDVDHVGICGCTTCTASGTRCRCECHAPCP